jgi:hypothetical protein
MSISDLRPHTSPAAVLAEVVAAVRDLDATWWTNQSDDDLVAAVELVEQARSALAAVQAGAVAEADARDLAKDRLHYGSTGDWLTHLGGLRKGEGKRLVKRAHAVTGSLTATREGMATGTVSPEQADIIVSSIAQLPSGEVVRGRGEATLLEHAGALDASELARTGRHLVHVVDPAATDRKLERQLEREERAAHHDRYLSIVADGTGGVRLKGRGTAEDGAVLKTALLPLAKPEPAAGESAECADPGQPVPVRDPREHGARMWDALVRAAQHVLDTHLPPTSHTLPARVTVTIGLDALRDGVAERALTGVVGSDLSVATIRRLACDAEVIPVVLDGQGEPLDVGRTRRLVTGPIWTALLARDIHCTFPGCDRPPVMCHAHHIRHWVDGGDTELGNLVMLCGHHHRVIHDSPWQLRLSSSDHKPEFLPPPKPGVERHWIRHRPRQE